MPRFLSPYRVLLRMPGTARFLIASFIARLGMAMIGVSSIVMIATRRDSYALAGLVSFVSLMAMAIGSPLVARLVDRFGQARVVVPTGLLAIGCAALVALETYTGAPDWLLLVTGLGQAFAPATGTYVRSRWVHILGDDPEALHTATSFESVSEEACFMIGPALGAFLAAAVFPEAGVLVACALSLVGLLVLMAHRASEPPVTPVGEHHGGAAVRAPGLFGLAITVALTGAIFGSMDVVVIAYAEAENAKELGGVILGVFAGGSLIGGLLYGLMPSGGRLAGRITIGTLAMFVLLIPALWTPNLLVLSINALVAGLAIAPLIITTMLLAQRLVPASQLNEGMTVVLTGVLVGVAVGSAGAGQAIETIGAHDAFLVPVIAAGLAFVLALLWRRGLVRAEEAAAARVAAAPRDAVSA